MDLWIANFKFITITIDEEQQLILITNRESSLLNATCVALITPILRSNLFRTEHDSFGYNVTRTASLFSKVLKCCRSMTPHQVDHNITGS